jgi:hypothetical protein
MKENLTSLIEKTEKELAALGKTLMTKAAGACVTLGKVIFALQSKAPEGVSMAKHILSTMNATRADVPSVSWCVAVCCAFIGDGGGEQFTEPDLDKTPARWLALASAIYSAIAAKLADDKEPMNKADAVGYREQVANIIRERPANGYELLRAMRDKIKGKAKGKETGKGGGEKETEETGEELSPVEKALACMKEAARLLAEAEPDGGTCKVFRRLAISIGKLAKLKGKSAPDAPVSPLRMEGGTLVPVAPAPVAPARKPRGKRNAAAASAPAGTTSLADAFEKAAA